MAHSTILTCTCAARSVSELSPDGDVPTSSCLPLVIYPPLRDRVPKTVSSSPSGFELSGLTILLGSFAAYGLLIPDNCLAAQ